MHNKVKLDVVGLTSGQAQNGSYTLIMGEKGSKVKLPIVIGNYEAQTIAFEIEGLKPSRPMTHDLFKSFADRFDIVVKQVIIHKLVDGVFYSSIICERDKIEEIIDARTSDAIALALRFSAPIFTYKNILDKAGIYLNANPSETENTEDEGALSTPETFGIESDSNAENSYTKLSLSELHELLESAVQDEDYEKAARIRDEISKRES